MPSLKNKIYKISYLLIFVNVKPNQKINDSNQLNNKKLNNKKNKWIKKIIKQKEMKYNLPLERLFIDGIRLIIKYFISF